MKAQVFAALNRLEYRDLPMPGPERGQLVVKVEYCGICGTDIHSYRNGLLIAPGMVMGHECVGTVSEPGAGVGAFKVGDRVVINPMPRCGACQWCEQGRYSLCPEAARREIGISPGHDGGFAEYVKIRHPNEMLHRIPDVLSLRAAALAEPLAVALHGVRRSRLRPGGSALVVGAGMIGLGVVEFLRVAGAGRILVVDVSDKKNELALGLGADHALNPRLEGAGLGRKILELTDEAGPDVVFECGGRPTTFRDSIEYAQRGGQVLLIGFCEEDVGVNPLRIVLKEIEITAALGYDDEFPEVIDALARGEIHAEAYISGVIPLAELDAGFRRVIADPDGIKYLARP